MTFLFEEWFWRGTQSAIFYYVSCAPCVEFQYKRKRRNEAARAEKQRAEIIVSQPGRVQQPGAFQTNEGWAEEILRGPGPPKGWKPDPILQKITPSEREQFRNGDVEVSPRSPMGPFRSGITNESGIVPQWSKPLTSTPPIQQPASPARPKPIHAIDFQRPGSDSRGFRTNAISSSDSSVSLTDSSEHEAGRPRPSLDRRLSRTIDNFKDTLRSTMKPTRWNWKRYERDDEILSGFNERMIRMWDRATSYVGQIEHDGKKPGTPKRRRAETNESDRFDYQKYIRNPAVNELHPPVVSKLPTTRGDAAWMLLPPPSAAVMEGKTRPQDEPALRWPLAQIGRDGVEWVSLRKQHGAISIPGFPYGSGSANGKTHPERVESPESTPDLSGSLSDESLSEREDDWRNNDDPSPRTAPVPGFTFDKGPDFEVGYLKHRETM